MYKSGRPHKSFSKSQHDFSVSQGTSSRQRSTIDMPSRTTTAIDGGPVYPIYLQEVLPGDTFQLRCQTKGWLSTIIVPFLDNLYLDTFFFFVPNRLVWENWAKFQGEKINPGDTTTYVVPQIEIAGGMTTGRFKLADYLGLPLNATTKKVNALPFRGFNLIWNDYFRDINLQDSVVVDIDDADSDEADYEFPLPRGRRKDYLTGALPWPQAPGDGLEPGIISGMVPVVSAGDGIPSFDASAETDIDFETGTTANRVDYSGTTIGAGAAFSWNTTALQADLDNAAANNINQLRQSISIQQLLELDARAGTRHPEQIKARFGVTSSDQRLQRPEYLGGGHSNISVSPVPGTNQGPTGPQTLGQVGAFGHIDASGGGFTHSFTEHGFVFGLINLRTDYTYFEGLPRFWSRETRYDYYEPALAHLGEQPVYNQEIYVSNVDADDFGPDGVWGYQERFSEYKFGHSMVTSIIRPNATAGLPFWTLAEWFNSPPTLNAAFIEDNPGDGIERVIAVSGEPHLILDCYFSNRCTRVMPVFNTPGLTRL